MISVRLLSNDFHVSIEIYGSSLLSSNILLVQLVFIFLRSNGISYIAFSESISDHSRSVSFFNASQSFSILVVGATRIVVPTCFLLCSNSFSANFPHKECPISKLLSSSLSK